MITTPVELILEDRRWLDALPEFESLCGQAANLALSAVSVGTGHFEFCVLACDDRRITVLNTDFRDKAVPTNVLSWPAFDLAPSEPGGQPVSPSEEALNHQKSCPIHLGDIAIAYETTLKEAKDASIPLKDHVIHLILHGVLHLLGYDHKIDADARIMEGLESRLLTGAGVPDPYSRGVAAPPQSD